MPPPEPTARLNPASVAAFYLPEPAAAPWSGRSILFRDRPDGSVAATSCGFVAVGMNEDEALRRLDELIRRGPDAGLQGRPLPVSRRPWYESSGEGHVT